MRCVDVNVLVHAHREDAPDHAGYLAWIEEARRADEPLGLTGVVLAGFVRVVTHPRVFREPSRLDDAFAFVEALRTAPNAIPAEPGSRHWEIFTRLCRTGDARGNRVPDAYLAAIAMEYGATLCTADRGFARYAGLRRAHPLDDPVV